MKDKLVREECHNSASPNQVKTQKTNPSHIDLNFFSKIKTSHASFFSKTSQESFEKDQALFNMFQVSFNPHNLMTL